MQSAISCSFKISLKNSKMSSRSSSSSSVSSKDSKAPRKSKKNAKDECKEVPESEDPVSAETKEFENNREQIQEWMEKLARVKKEEFDREEASIIPMRNYLMAHVVPALTKGLVDVTRTRPEDPIDFLAEILFQNNEVQPGGRLNPNHPQN